MSNAMTAGPMRATVPEPLKLAAGLAATAGVALLLMNVGDGTTVVPPPPPKPVFTGEAGGAKMAVTVVPAAVSLAQGITVTFTDPATSKPFAAVESVSARVLPPGEVEASPPLRAVNPQPGVYSITLVKDTAFRTPGPHTVRLSAQMGDGTVVNETIPVKVAAKPKPPAVPTRK